LLLKTSKDSYQNYDILGAKLPVIQRREYGKNGTIYSQYRLNIPQKIFNSLRWNEIDEIELIIVGNDLICKNVTKSQNRAKNY